MSTCLDDYIHRSIPMRATLKLINVESFRIDWYVIATRFTRAYFELFMSLISLLLSFEVDFKERKPRWVRAILLGQDRFEP
jgi:hypothetical protein